MDNSELWIVGDNDKEIAKKITKIEKNNIFVNHVNEFELPNLYNQASIFCLPSFEEGQPTVVAQAMACELPIISTSFAADLVENHQEGFIVEPSNTNQIADKIKYFHQNPDQILEMGKKARQKVIRLASFDVIANRIVSFADNKIIK